MPLSDSDPSRVAAHRCDRSTRPATSKRLCDRSDRVSSSAYRRRRPRNAAIRCLVRSLESRAGRRAVPSSFCQRVFVFTRMQIADLVADLRIDLVESEVASDADGVLDRFRVRAAVADDASAIDPEERGAAVFGVIHALNEALERALHEERSGLAHWSFVQ